MVVCFRVMLRATHNGDARGSALILELRLAACRIHEGCGSHPGCYKEGVTHTQCLRAARGPRCIPHLSAARL